MVAIIPAAKSAMIAISSALKAEPGAAAAVVASRE